MPETAPTKTATAQNGEHTISRVPITTNLTKLVDIRPHSVSPTAALLFKSCPLKPEQL